MPSKKKNEDLLLDGAAMPNLEGGLADVPEETVPVAGLLPPYIEEPVEVNPGQRKTKKKQRKPEDQSEPLESLSLPNLSQAATRPKSIYELKLNDLDRGLSEVEQREWNSIYASFRSRSILTGTVLGADMKTFDVINRDTRETETLTIHSAVLVDYRVKVLIPETELWMPDDEKPAFLAKGMVGSKIDYIILEVDREGECAIASRRMAMMARRGRFFAVGQHQEGDLLTCRVIVVGAKRCTVECQGFDFHMTQRELSYTAIADLREKYHPGQELPCLIKRFDPRAEELEISVKEAYPNPFVGAELRHPIGSRRQAVIAGKYAGGVFCNMPDGVTCLCIYSTQLSDADFQTGDTVILNIRDYDYDREFIFARIVTKW